MKWSILSRFTNYPIVFCQRIKSCFTERSVVLDDEVDRCREEAVSGRREHSQSVAEGKELPAAGVHGSEQMNITFDLDSSALSLYVKYHH